VSLNLEEFHLEGESGAHHPDFGEKIAASHFWQNPVHSVTYSFTPYLPSYSPQPSIRKWQETNHLVTYKEAAGCRQEEGITNEGSATCASQRKPPPKTPPNPSLEQAQ
jgi:hypothetical protein